MVITIIITIIIAIIIIIIIVIIIIGRHHADPVINNLPETRKYWVDVQRGIVLSHGERDPL